MAFSFEIPVQRAILRLCMQDETFNQKAMEYVKAEFFTTEPLGWLFTAMSRYWDSYRLRCTELPLREILRQLPSEHLPLYTAEVDAVVALGNVPEADFVKHELAEFCKRAVFMTAHREATLLFNEGKHDESYDIMGRAHDRIQQIRFDGIDRQWFFEELGPRTSTRLKSSIDSVSECYTTGIPKLDKLTDGGIHRGEMWAVFAYAKRCKSTWLINQGFNATRVHHAPTLHIVLEGSGKQIAARYDACFSQELYRSVKKGEIDPVRYEMLQNEYQRLRGLLVIRTMNDWDANVKHVQDELVELRAHGFIPEVLVVDYVDLFRSRDRVDSETQHQLNASRDLKRLVNQHDLACWTAWQAQRPKVGADDKEHILMAAQVADAYGKVRIVDSYGSLNATKKEMAANTMRVYWEEHREHEVSSLFLIENDLKTQRMITRVLELPKPPVATAAT